MSRRSFTSNTNNYHYLFKYILVGDSNVGKSSLLMRFIQNRFAQNYQPTLGVEFGSKNFKIQETSIRAMIWDTAGQQTFKSIIRTYYKNAIIALLLFDCTNLLSFNNLQKWVDQIKKNSHQHIKIVVAANKVDLQQKRYVSTEEAKQFADTNGFKYIQISAKTGQNVSQIFSQAAKLVIQDINSKKIILHNNSNLGIKIGSPDSYALEQDRYIQQSSIRLGAKSNEKDNSCKC